MHQLIRFSITAFVVLCALAAPCSAEQIPLLVTVDDLPLAQGSLYADPEERARITTGLLAALEKHGIRAVGFVTWRNIDRSGDRQLLERWLDAGHELGNHSSSHLSLSRTDVETYIDDVESARRQISELVEGHGKKLRFFRYPLLHEGDKEQKYDAVRDYLTASGQRPVPVTLDNSDYASNREWVEVQQSGDAAASQQVAQAYHEGLHVAIRSQAQLSTNLFGRAVPQVLLLHANAIGASQWDELFTWLRQQGFRFATADEVLSDDAFEQDPRWIGRVGPGLWQRMDSVERRQQAADEVSELLQTQAAAWNRGDLEVFTSVYADDALFASPKGITRGRAEVLAQYRKSYPDRAAMGTLSLEIVEIRLADGIERTAMGESVPSRVHGATVVARWRLAYPGDEDRFGLTMLAIKPTGGGWSITQDASF